MLFRCQLGNMPLIHQGLLDAQRGAAVAEGLSSWLAEKEVRGSIPRLAT